MLQSEAERIESETWADDDRLDADDYPFDDNYDEDDDEDGNSSR